MPAARPARLRTLSVDRIVDMAVEITETEGVEALSMRRLTQSLGVTTMALYGHVRNKRDLLDLVADRYLAELELPGNEIPWEDWLARLFGSLHALVRQPPVLASYTLGFTLSQTARLGADRTVDEQVQDLRDRSAEYPHLAAVAEPLVGWPAEPLFEHGLALVIGGLRPA